MSINFNWNDYDDTSSARTSLNVEKFKMKDKGERTRFMFALVNPKTKQVALKKVTYFQYNNNVTKQWAKFIAPENVNSQAYKVAQEHCGVALTSYVTPILVYSTNTQGRVISGDDYELTNLVLTPTRLTNIKSIQAEHDLSQCDILVTLEDAKYQKMLFASATGCGVTDGFINQKDKQGNLKKTEININRDEVINEAIKMIDECETAVANNWTEQTIINYFKKDDEFDDEFDDVPFDKHPASSDDDEPEF